MTRGPHPAPPAVDARPLGALTGVLALIAAACLALVSAHTAKAAGAPPPGWTTVVNKSSGKCVDARAATAVQQYACDGSGAQQWRFRPVGGGSYQVDNYNDNAEAWDSNVSAADGAPLRPRPYAGGASQRWQPVQEPGGTFHFVNRGSGKCLDVPRAAASDGVRLQQWTCDGTAAQSFTVAAAVRRPPGTPDFGPDVSVFDPSMPAAAVQSRLDAVYRQQQTNQFGDGRYALLFKPGRYDVNASVGFYTQVLGLGPSPDDVTINGGVHVDARWDHGNATQNFWRGAENLSVNPSSGTDQWAVSQAAPYRRVHLRGSLRLDDGGWSSGGFIADSVIDGQVRPGTQQQWLSRNTEWGGWTGANWNMVFVGDGRPPSGAFPHPPYTVVDRAPVTREKPFLYIDGSGAYQVFVPAARSNTRGTTWAHGTPAGSSVPVSRFFIARPDDCAAEINAALAQGRNVLFTPGVYHLDRPLKVTRPDTVVLGLGLATLVPDNGVTAVSVADVGGVQLAGLLIDAGPVNSAVLVRIGPDGSSGRHASDPTALHDVFFRVGGAGPGRATQSLVVNSSDVIGDDLWLWRADHGSGVGWDTNTAANGLVVNGDDVTMYGLFVEHYQRYQVVWNGDGGRTYFFQNELPYDPPNQAAWRSGANGYAAYKVADSVTRHEAWGLGSYCYFHSDPSVVADRSFEVPDTPGVRLHDLVTVSLGGAGTISHIVNRAGGPSNSAHSVAYLVNYP